MIKVLVCGGRDFGNVPPKQSPQYKKAHREYLFVWNTLISFCQEKGILNDDPYDIPDANKIEIIEGGAVGADRAAHQWAIHNYINVKTFEANWKEFGAAAGPIRNARMLDEGKPDIIIAFPGGRGTANMVKQARERGIEVREIEYNGKET